MTEITTKDIKTVIEAIDKNTTDELTRISSSDLEKYWYFEYDKSSGLVWNIYKFHDSLDLYKSFCMQWEEQHNGSCCVVERVRDKYLMPKIKEFHASIRAEEAEMGEEKAVFTIEEIENYLYGCEFIVLEKEHLGEKNLALMSAINDLNDPEDGIKAVTEGRKK